MSRASAVAATVAAVTPIDLGFVAAYLVGEGPWVLIDTGMPWHFKAIVAAAERRYGKGTRPTAIYLTHGHGDHCGAALALAAYWDVPIYAHPTELPYLTGQHAYPPGDPAACGGPLRLLTHFQRPQRSDLRPRIQPLPAGDVLPGLAGWEAIPLAGHTPGQVGFWNADARVMIAGDALMTINPGSWRATLTGKKKLNWPPPSFTTDWFAARRSIETIAALAPTTLFCGHGKPMAGERLPEALHEFAAMVAIPRYGRYISEPVRYTPDGEPIVAPVPPDPVPLAVTLVGVAAVAGVAYWWWRGRGGRA